MVTFEMVGGRVCLDFVNTGSRRTSGPFGEKLESYQDLLDWSVQAADLLPEEAAHLADLAAADPAGAEAVLERGRALREAIYRVFVARQAETALDPEDLRIINEEHARAAVNRVLTPGGIGICNFEFATFDAIDRPLWHIAVSAVNLMSSTDTERVKECGTDNCNWLFLDTSKNRSRRWCDMKECGNREKARRHYRRKKGSA